MKIPLFPKNETYINIIIAVFSIIIIFAMFFRIPLDKSNMSVAVFFDDDNRILFYTGKEEISQDVQLIIPVEEIKISEEEFLKKVNGKYVGNLEFYGNPEFITNFYEKTHYNKIIKVHYVKPKELQRYNSFTLFKRLWRAVVERSVEVIILPDSDTLLEAFGKFSNFFQVSNQIPKPDNTNWNNKIFSILLGIFVSLQMPVTIFSFLFLNTNWLFISIVSIIGTIACFFSTKNNFTRIANFFILGALTNFSLYSFEYLNDLETYRGVKLSLIALPTAFVLKELFSTISEKKSKKRSIDKKQIALFAVLFVITGTYVILRSGNYGYVTDLEERFRLLLENVFIIRPRIKELIFIPVLLLSSDLKNKYISEIFAFLGTFALVSIFNSFCHIKAPIFVTFYREIITIIVGAVIYSIIVIIKNLINVWTGKS
uniref:Uncharacterized protein n=1 Tax=Fervidobacterium nodosum TaxID=2424 RepID=A0A7C5U5W8_9BACT